MFVKDATPYAAVLARGRLHDDACALSVNADVWYELGPGGALTWRPEAPEPAETDPPDIKRRDLWKGTAVTAVGWIHGPKAAPYARPVRLVVGDREVRLAAFGPRVWEASRFGRPAPSQPAPFDAIPMSWSLAFGGAWDLPPGLLPGTDLPHPGGRVAYPLNPAGRGFHVEDARAVGQPLPQLELASDLVDRPDRWAEPLTFAPSEPAALALHLQAMAPRIVPAPGKRSTSIPDAITSALSLQHYAAPRCVFPTLAAGTSILLEGVGDERVALRVPASPLTVRLRRKREATALAGAARAVHVDVTRRLVLVRFGHQGVYDPNQAPDWVHIERSAA